MTDEQRSDGEKLREIWHTCQAIITNTEDLEGVDISTLMGSDWTLAIIRGSVKRILEIVITVNHQNSPLTPGDDVL